MGGVLSGQSLIRASELRKVSEDVQRYTSAVYSFRDKYFALPGDMTNATQFWGVAGGTGNDATCYNTVSTDMRTCNGNGNGILFYDDGVTDGSAPEWYRGWQHLANAELVSGNFTGTRDPSQPPAGATPGLNIPRGSMSNTGFTFLTTIKLTTDPDWFGGKYTGFAFGTSGYGYESMGSSLRPEQAWNLDTKLDDGKPGLGRLRTTKNASLCISTTDPATSAYILTSTVVGCNMFFAIEDPGT